MAYDPMSGFQIGQAVGKSRGSAYGNTAKYMSDLEAERDKQKIKTSPLELMMLKNMIPPSAKDAATTDLAKAKTGWMDCYTHLGARGDQRRSEVCK